MSYIVFQLFILAVLLCVSAFFSCAETAFSSLTKFKIKSLIENPQTAKKINIWIEHSDTILTTVLVCNTTVNIVITLLVFFIVRSLLPGIALKALFVFTAGTAALLIIFFCEIIPKMYGRHRFEFIAVKVVSMLYKLSRLLSFVIRLLTWAANLALSLFGIKHTQKDLFITEDEIRSLIDLGKREGALEEEERKMIKSIFDFGDTIVREVMVPRMEISAVPDTLSVAKAVRAITEEAVSRLPVYHEDIDHIIGILYARDIFDYILQGKSLHEINVTDVVHEPYFVPESKRLDELLKEFQKEQRHIAIAVDEYGGTAGLVTIEDLLEEIVGEIQDEYDEEEEQLIKQVGKDKYLADGRYAICDFEEEFNCSVAEEDEDYDTISGLLFHRFGRIPQEGEEVDMDGLVLRVHEADDRHIIRVMIEKRSADG